MKITSIDSSPEIAVSHNPLVRKRLLIANGEIDRLTNFSRAVFPPGEVAPSHCHADMSEVFYIESGDGAIEVDGKVIGLPQGSCITISPGEFHELRNSGDREMVVLYFAVLSNSAL